ncbi:MAG TPA: XrtA system polysaccharide deacetylase [Blastocatellia bacterium]|nr:XrtA system polysaccharide deacetylase [Blastocatellia bacterium]
MKNAMSIDLEDWFCVHNMEQAIDKRDWDACEMRVVENTRSILELLARHKTEATFFVLGWVAERAPDLVREIAARGHEIATHGYSHTLLTDMTPESFEEDLRRAIHVTRDCVDQEIVGFRAPSFTVTNKTLWAVEVLTRNGIRYDSSVFPVGFHPDYGMPNASLAVYRHNDKLVEVPLSCAEIMGKRIPCSGGGYFRIFPYALTKRLLKRCNAQGRPAIFYLHPWELDPKQPRMKLPLLKKFRHYYNLDKTLARLDRLLGDFEFTSVRKVIGL